MNLRVREAERWVFDVGDKIMLSCQVRLSALVGGVLVYSRARGVMWA